MGDTEQSFLDAAESLLEAFASADSREVQDAILNALDAISIGLRELLDEYRSGPQCDVIEGLF